MRIAAIVPAYNEETRIVRVLQVVTRCPEISEVWVVSDGSTDRTYEVAAQTPGAKAMRLPVNRGKGAAMMEGALCAHADALLFLDADLDGLTPAHVADLIEPVASGRAEMSVGVFQGGRFLTDLAQRLVPHISGQRCMLRSAFLRARHVADLRYGVEVALYRHAQSEAMRIDLVPLRGMTHPMKEEKVGFARGAVCRMRMYSEIARGLITPTLESRRVHLTRLLKERIGNP